MVYKDMCNLYNKYNTKLAIMAGKYNTKTALVEPIVPIVVEPHGTIYLFSTGLRPWQNDDAYSDKHKSPLFERAFVKYFVVYIFSSGIAKLKLNRLTLVCELP